MSTISVLDILALELSWWSTTKKYVFVFIYSKYIFHEKFTIVKLKNGKKSQVLNIIDCHTMISTDTYVVICQSGVKNCTIGLLHDFATIIRMVLTLMKSPIYCRYECMFLSLSVRFYKMFKQCVLFKTNGGVQIQRDVLRGHSR